MKGIEKSLEIVRHSCYKEVTSLIHSFIHLQKKENLGGGCGEGTVTILGEAYSSK